MSADATIEGFTAIFQRGFEDTNERMDLGFMNVNGRLDRIENTILADHEFRLKCLEISLTPSHS